MGEDKFVERRMEERRAAERRGELAEQDVEEFLAAVERHEPHFSPPPENELRAEERREVVRRAADRELQAELGSHGLGVG